MHNALRPPCLEQEHVMFVYRQIQIVEENGVCQSTSLTDPTVVCGKCALGGLLHSHTSDNARKATTPDAAPPSNLSRVLQKVLLH